MCGICGIAIPEHAPRQVDAAALTRMRDTLMHRGPDDAGLLLDAHVALGHRRLSIVDLAGGHQPMFNEDESIAIVYNGEVYNHSDYRADLEARGHRYRSHCDTETILHLYEEHGRRCVEFLRGMFAFAIWDRPRRRLLLARDRLGIKPLYYTLSQDGTLHFASEIKALLEAKSIKPELNYAALSDYAANRATSGEATLFRGVKRLLPGHTLEWQDGRVQINRYWDVSFSKPDETLSDEDYVARFDELFREAVRLRLMADVPLGMFLSGGIDSSAIAAVMSQLVREPIKTFSVAFAEREANELEYARLVARAFKTEHHEVVVSPDEFFAALPQMVYQEDEPIAHPSSVPLYFVSELARQHVKVVLTGEGSDELLAGYDKYRKTVYNLALGRRYHRFAPAWMKRAVAQTIQGLRGSSRVRQKLQRTFLCLEPELQHIYFDNFAVFTRAMQGRLFTAEAREQMGEGEPYRASLEQISGSDAETLLDQLLAADMKTYLHELLMKQDQMSMAASIESRVPFLDHHLVELACALPERMKLRGLETKHILRQAMKGVLPREILTRRKMGFPVPVGAWLRGRYRHVVEEYVLSERAAARGVFDPQYVRELVARHEAGENHAERLWALINFEIWQRRFFDNEAATNERHATLAAVGGQSSAVGVITR
ncbi:MAG TPA: asparagine synthase (glutamine-hydrolyzing) [Blastocatellia bacterium]|nr:asparagine synthase (glutamine-hydrolyzing) [Blastocatellia bacterium]